MFLGLFLLVRGLPALLYRKDLPRHDMVSLGLLQSAALVGAGLLSVVLFPIIGLGIHHRGEEAETAHASLPHS